MDIIVTSWFARPISAGRVIEAPDRRLLLVLVAATAYDPSAAPRRPRGASRSPSPLRPRATGPGVHDEDRGRQRFTLTDDGVYVLAFWSTLNVSSDKAEPGFKELAEEYDNDEATFAAVYVNGAPEDYQAPPTPCSVTPTAS